MGWGGRTYKVEISSYLRVRISRLVGNWGVLRPCVCAVPRSQLWIAVVPQSTSRSDQDERQMQEQVSSNRRRTTKPMWFVQGHSEYSRVRRSSNGSTSASPPACAGWADFKYESKNYKTKLSTLTCLRITYRYWALREPCLDCLF